MRERVKQADRVKHKLRDRQTDGRTERERTNTQAESERETETDRQTEKGEKH